MDGENIFDLPVDDPAAGEPEEPAATETPTEEPEQNQDLESVKQELADAKKKLEEFAG